ncbi:MAG: hypothetical protein M3Y55_18940 [Pseudomonadota bacterium]|nr:hypothetical protein [Pseudomonadota bacterium]
MSYLKTTMGSVGAMVAVAAAGLAFIPTAHADAQYKADRAYCMSGEASEARDLCLKEAAAAQAERQEGPHGAVMHHKHRSVRKDAAAAPERSASTP